MNSELRRRATGIRLVIFDVDGVLTDGRLHVHCDGTESKSFNVRDGHGIKLLRESGIEAAIISGRRSESVVHRMRDLGVEHVYLGIEDKLQAFQELLEKTGLDPNQVAYVGDDIVDLPVMRRIGLAIAVADADAFVLEHAHWRTPRQGGRGAARDACEMILQAQGVLAPLRARYVS